MADNSKASAWLYKKLSARRNMGSKEEFDKRIKSEKNRKQLYGLARSYGLEVGDWDNFNQVLGGLEPPKVEEPIPTPTTEVPVNTQPETPAPAQNTHLRARGILNLGNPVVSEADLENDEPITTQNKPSKAASAFGKASVNKPVSPTPAEQAVPTEEHEGQQNAVEIPKPEAAPQRPSVFETPNMAQEAPTDTFGLNKQKPEPQQVDSVKAMEEAVAKQKADTLSAQPDSVNAQTPDVAKDIANQEAVQYQQAQHRIRGLGVSTFEDNPNREDFLESDKPWELQKNGKNPKYLTDEDKGYLATEEGRAMASAEVQRQLDQYNAISQRAQNHAQTLLDNYNDVVRASIEAAPIPVRTVQVSEDGGRKEVYMTPDGMETTDPLKWQIANMMFAPTISGQIRKHGETLANLKERQAEIKEEIRKRESSFKSLISNFTPGSEDYDSFVLLGKEYAALQAAIMEEEKALQTLCNRRDADNGKDIGFWRGFGEVALDPSEWSFGIPELKNAMTKLEAANKLGKGQDPSLDSLYLQLLQSTYENQEIQSKYGDFGFWYRAGGIGGYMPILMTHFIVTGGGYSFINWTSKAAATAAKGIALKSAEKAMEKGSVAALNLVLKEAMGEGTTIGFKTYLKEGLVQGLQRWTAQQAAPWMVKAVGYTGEELLLRAPLMTNTVGLPGVAADAINRKLGDVQIKDGQYTFANDKSWGEAKWEAEADAIIENFSEMFGTHIDAPLTKFAGKAAEMFGIKAVSEAMTRLEGSAFGRYMSKTMDFTKKNLGVGDFLGEVSEEYYGQLWRTMLNLPDAYYTDEDGQRKNNFLNPDFHLDIWGGMALTMPMLSGGRAVASTPNYMYWKHRVDKAEARAANTFTDPEVWENVKKLIDNTPNNEIVKALELLGGGYEEKLSLAEYQALLNYTEASLNFRGYNLGTLRQQREKEIMKMQMERTNELMGQIHRENRDEYERLMAIAEGGYMDGINANSPIDQQLVLARYLDAEAQYLKMIQELEIPQEVAATLQNEGMDGLLSYFVNTYGANNQYVQTVVQYINANNAYEGMLQSVNNDIDSAIEASNAQVDKETNKDSGRVTYVRTKRGRDTRAVVKGRIAFDQNGGVDWDNTDKDLLVLNTETGKVEFVSREQISELVEEHDPEELKQKNEEAIRSEMSQSAADTIEGHNLQFYEGEQFSFTDFNGMNTFNYVVTPNEQGLIENPDGTINCVTSDSNGEVVPIRKEFLETCYQQEGQPSAQAQPTEAIEGGELQLFDGATFVYTNPNGRIETFTIVPNREGNIENPDGTINTVGDDGITYIVTREFLESCTPQGGQQTSSEQPVENNPQNNPEDNPQGSGVVEETPSEGTPTEDLPKPEIKDGKTVKINYNGTPTDVTIVIADDGNGNVVVRFGDGETGHNVPFKREEFEGMLMPETPANVQKFNNGEKFQVTIDGEEVTLKITDIFSEEEIRVGFELDGVWYSYKKISSSDLNKLINGEISTIPNFTKIDSEFKIGQKFQVPYKDSTAEINVFIVFEDEDRPIGVTYRLPNGDSNTLHVTRDELHDIIKNGLDPSLVEYNPTDNGSQTPELSRGHRYVINYGGNQKEVQIVRLTDESVTFRVGDEIKGYVRTATKEDFVGMLVSEVEDDSFEDPEEKEEITIGDKVYRLGDNISINDEEGGQFFGPIVSFGSGYIEIADISVGAYATEIEGSEDKIVNPEISDGENIYRPGDVVTLDLEEGELKVTIHSIEDDRVRFVEDGIGEPVTSWMEKEDFIDSIINPEDEETDDEDGDDTPTDNGPDDNSPSDGGGNGGAPITEGGSNQGGTVTPTEGQPTNTPQGNPPTDQTRPAGKPDPALRQRYENSNKVYGRDKTIILPDGTEIKGRWVLIPNDAVTPSHDWRNGYNTSEGFPTTADGRNANSRDYTKEENQRSTKLHAAAYDGRAISNPVIVTKDGVVLSGNDRTISGLIAADRNTDAKYMQYMRNEAESMGFTKEQIESMPPHSRVVFEMNDEVDNYTPALFDKFNSNDTKAVDNVEMSEKSAYTLDDNGFERIIAKISPFDTMSAFHSNTDAVKAVLGILNEKGVITKEQMPMYYSDIEGLSETGKEFLRNILIGKVFQANPKTAQLLASVPSIGKTVENALAAIIQNRTIRSGFSLTENIINAIEMSVEARKNGYKHGDRVSIIAAQGRLNLDAENEEEIYQARNKPEYQNVMTRMLADMLNDKSNTWFRDFLKAYNKSAISYTTGSQDTLFEEERKTPEDIFVAVAEEVAKKKRKDLNTTRTTNETQEQQPTEIGGTEEGNPQSTNVSEGDKGNKPTSGESSRNGEGTRRGNQEQNGASEETTSEGKSKPKKPATRKGRGVKSEETTEEKPSETEPKGAETPEGVPTETTEETPEETKENEPEEVEDPIVTLLKTDVNSMTDEQKAQVRGLINALTDELIDPQVKNRALLRLDGVNSIPVRASYIEAKQAILNNLDHVRNTTNNLEPDSGNADTPQPTPTDAESGRGRDRRDGGQPGDVGGTESGGTVSEVENDGENGSPRGDTPSGKRSNSGVRKKGAKNKASDSGDSGRSGGSRTDGDGHNVSGQEGNTPSSTDATNDKEGGNLPPRGSSERLAQDKKEVMDLWNDLKIHVGKRLGKDYSLKDPITPDNFDQQDDNTVVKLSKIINKMAGVGLDYVLHGLERFEDWLNKMRNEFGAIMKEKLHLITDNQLVEWFKIFWQTHVLDNGITKTVEEWAAYRRKKRREKEMGKNIEEKREEQKAAELLPVELCDMANIRETLPFLLPEQQEDVMRAETQFFDESHDDEEHAYGKGYLFTNGTGTGKTYTGLGIIKRFVKQGKGRILIVTPTQTKCKDWAEDAKNMGLEVLKLKNTKDKGAGIITTTYANFMENRAILEDDFDLIVYDESHKLIENKHGEATKRCKKHFALTNHTKEDYVEHQKGKDPWFKQLAEEQAQLQTLKEKIEKLTKKGSLNKKEIAEFEKASEEIKELTRIIKEKEPEVKDREIPLERGWEDGLRNTKVVFLSATPFNTVENLRYAEGYIFSLKNPAETAYPTAEPFDAFKLETFPGAFTFSSGKAVESVENAMAVDQQEQAFADHLMEIGTMSGRQIDVPFDYSRSFPIITLDAADDVNLAVSQVYKDPRLKLLKKAVDKTFYDYTYSTALYETLKSQKVIQRIQEHLDLGRKVVVFHRRNNSGDLEKPFSRIVRLARESVAEEGESEKQAMEEAIRVYRAQYHKAFEWEKTLNLKLTREQIVDAFGDRARVFYGSDKQKVSEKAMEEFNQDDSGADILIVQEEAGKEGISLHDKTGKHQRVLMSLALPVSPITVLQTEGRIYRIGVKTNAIFEYPLLGLDSESILFGKTFSERAKTTENLALGSKSRDMMAAFSNALIENSGVVDIGENTQGTGGKEMDSRKTVGDPYKQAITDYNGTKNANPKDPRKAKGYVPTPEPLGYMMVQWAALAEGDEVLEPSAGHGAIARYVPKSNNMTVIEPEAALFNQVQLRSAGKGRKFEQCYFEDFSINNKFDAVIMNPPTELDGKKAMAHVKKAFKHLREGGRLVALVPNNAEMEAALGKWMGETKEAVATGEVSLPSNYRLVIFDKISDKKTREREEFKEFKYVDLSDCKNEDEFFSRLKDVEMPKRKIDRAAVVKGSLERLADRLKDKNEMFGRLEYTQTQDGELESVHLIMRKTKKDGAQLWSCSRFHRVQYDYTPEMVLREFMYQLYKENSEVDRDPNAKASDKAWTSARRDLLNTLLRLHGLTMEELAKKENWFFLGTLSKQEEKMRDDVYALDDVELPGLKNDLKRKLNYDNPQGDKLREIHVKLQAISDRQSGKVEQIDKDVDWSELGELSVQEQEFISKLKDKTLMSLDGERKNLNETVAELAHKIQSNENWIRRMKSNGRNTSGVESQVEILKERFERAKRDSKIAKMVYLQKKTDITKILRQFDVELDKRTQIDKMKEIFDAYNTDPLNRALFDKVWDVVKNLKGLHVIFSSNYSGSIGGSYYHPDRQVTIDANDVSEGNTEQLANTMLHELIHAATVYMIRCQDQFYGNTKVMDALGQIQSLYNAISDDPSFKGMYGIQDVKEMLSEISNPKFRALLEKKKMWGQLSGSFMKLFNIETPGATETNAYDALRDALMTMLENENEAVWYSTSHSKIAWALRNLFPRLWTGLNKPGSIGISSSDGIRFSVGKPAKAKEEKKPKEVEINLTKEEKAAKKLHEQGIPPRKTRFMYKLFEVDEYGRPKALFIDKQHPLGIYEWLFAQAPDFEKSLKNLEPGIYLIDPEGNATVYERNGKDPLKKEILALKQGYRYMKVKKGAKGDKLYYNIGINGSGGVTTFAYRPGWHCANVPAMNHLGEDPGDTGHVTNRRPNQRWFLIEIAADENYSEKGGQKNGTVDGLPYIPFQGYYLYKTNSGADKNISWAITGAIRIVRPLTEQEASDICSNMGFDRDLPYSGPKTFNENDVEDYKEMSKALAAYGVAERLKTPVRFVTDTDYQINDKDKAMREKKRNARGWYDTETGEVVIVLPNCADETEAIETLLHEVVGHKGLRDLFGDDFNTFLENIYHNVTPEIRKEINEKMSQSGFDMHVAVDEFLAELAEKTNFADYENQPWYKQLWKVITEAFMKMLRKKGINLQRPIDQNQLQYILWKSYQNLENRKQSAMFKEARDIEMRRKLKVDGEASEVRYASFSPRNTVDAREAYEERVNTGIFQAKEALQDSMLGLKYAMQEILRAHGENAEDEDIENLDWWRNPYLGENRLSSINHREVTVMERTLFDPLMQHVAKLSPTKADYVKLCDYLVAKHGLERNEFMATRDALQKTRENDPAATTPDPTILAKCREKDYAGLTELTGERTVEAAERKALKEYVEPFERDNSQEDVDQLWERIRKVTDATLKKVRDCGIISDETFDYVMDMYDYYVPLRGFAKETAEDTWGYVSNASAPFSAAYKPAKGRSSLAENPLAYMRSMIESAVSQGNRNRYVKQPLHKFAMDFPSDLITINKVWYKRDTMTNMWEPVFPDDLEEGDSPEVVAEKMKQFTEEMRNLAANDPDNFKQGYHKGMIPKRVVDAENRLQHHVLVRENGEVYMVTVCGNPRVAQAANGQTNPDIGTDFVSAGLGWLNRHLSAFYTTRNPAFMVTNFIRDAGYANSMVWIKERPNYAMRFHQNFTMNMARMYPLIAKDREGKLDTNNYVEKMFKEFLDNGGETGYTILRDIDQHKKAIEADVRKYRDKASVRKTWEWLVERLEDHNRAVELCARFTAYMTSREMGRDTGRATWDAKEISVNFNKKGSGSKFNKSKGQKKLGKVAGAISWAGRNGFVFWNAGIQGMTNFGKYAARNKGKAFALGTALFGMGVMMPFIAVLAGSMGFGGGDGDDEYNGYFNIPEYIRRSNFVFRVGGKWVFIPLPVEYRPIYGMGELAATTMFGPNRTDPKEIALETMALTTQILPVDPLEGGGGLTNFVPSALKPAFECYINKSWTGLPIYKDTDHNKNIPEWTKAYNNTNPYLVDLCGTINELTGGDKYTNGYVDLNPGVIEHLFRGYFGGYADMLDKTAKTIVNTSDGEFVPESTPILNRVLRNADERTSYRAVNNEYYKLKNQNDDFKRRFKGYKTEAQMGIIEYTNKFIDLNLSTDYQKHMIFETYNEYIEDIDKMIKTPGMPEDQVKYLKDMKAQVMRQMIDAVYAVE